MDMKPNEYFLETFKSFFDNLIEAYYRNKIDFFPMIVSKFNLYIYHEVDFLKLQKRHAPLTSFRYRLIFNYIKNFDLPLDDYLFDLILNNFDEMKIYEFDVFYLLIDRKKDSP